MIPFSRHCIEANIFKYILYCTQHTSLSQTDFLSLFSVYRLPRLIPQCWEVVEGNSGHMDVLGRKGTVESFVLILLDSSQLCPDNARNLDPEGT